MADVSVPGNPDAITPRWLEETLRSGGRWRPSAIEAVRATVIGVGYGLDGTVGRLAIEGPGPDEPRSLVAKFSTAENGRREGTFYEEVAPHMPVRLPGYYGHVVDAEADRSVVLLEDVAPARQGDCIVGASFEDAVAVLEGMARFHAAFLGEPLPAVEDLPAWEGRLAPLVERVTAHAGRFLARLEDAWRTAVTPIVGSLPDTLPDAHAQLADARRTLIHTDLHMDNVLFIEQGEPVFLDWPHARRGPAAVDVARVFVEGVNFRDRRRHEDALFAAYASARREAGAPVPDPESWRRELDAALRWMLAHAVAWAGAEDPRFEEPRAREIGASLARNAAAAAIDHLKPSGA